MVFSNKASKTKVEAIAFVSQEYPGSVLTILKIVSFLKWVGCLPVVVTSLSSGFLRMRFARLHVATVFWILTIALQIYLSIANLIQNKIFRNSPDVLANFLFLCSLFCSTIIIPRIGLTSITALESALNTIKEIQRSLSLNSRSFNLWPLTILVLILELLTVIPNFMQVYFNDGKTEVTKTLPFTLGTGIELIGIVVYGFWVVFFYISLWVVPIQLFMFCNTLASNYLDFADQIRHELYPDSSFSYQVESLEKSLTRDVGHSQKFRNRLKKLQATSVQLEKAVNDVNDYIGMALLLDLVCHFLHILGNLHYVSKLAPAVFLENSGEFIFLANATLMLVHNTAELLFVIWAADLIPRSVNRCKEAVLGIPFCDEDFKDEQTTLDHIQLQSFRSHIIAKNVEITAFGLFTISRKMIPPVLGTIITYYLIIAQYAQGFRSGDIPVKTPVNN